MSRNLSSSYDTPNEVEPCIVITLATEASNKQPVILSNVCKTSSEWLVKDLSISLFRDWSVSEARIVLTSQIENLTDPLPPLPNCYPYRGGANPYLTIEDEIRIYVGYISSETIVNQETIQNLLDEIPISVPGLPQPNYSLGKLVPVFWGFIDKIDFDGSSRGSGNQVILSCRDRMKVFNDTSVLALTNVKGNFKGGEINSIPTGYLSRIISDICFDVNGFTPKGPAITEVEDICWKPILSPSFITGGDYSFQLKEEARIKQNIRLLKRRDISRVITNEKLSSVEQRREISKILKESEEFYLRRAQFFEREYLNYFDERTNNLSSIHITNAEEQEILKELIELYRSLNLELSELYKDEIEYFNLYDDLVRVNNNISINYNTPERVKKSEEYSLDPSLFSRRSSNKIMNERTYPRVHCYINRPRIVSKNGGSSIQILDKSPISLVKWVASMCPEPIDFFSSHINGDFIFAPRTPDYSGLNDEYRNYRTYFYRRSPDLSGTVPCNSQMILNIRTTSSSAATINKATVINNQAMSGNGVSVLKGITNRIHYNDYSLEEREPSPAERNRNFYVSGNEYSSQEGASVLTGYEGLSQFSKNFNTITFDILGDPTFSPGEVVRIYGSFLHSEYHLTLFNETLRNKKKFDFIEKYSSISTKEFSISNKYKRDIDLNNDIKETIEAGCIPTNENNLVIPAYVVRSVNHKINLTAGFITTIQASLLV